MEDDCEYEGINIAPTPDVQSKQGEDELHNGRV